MQVSKSFLLAGTLLFCAASFPLAAPDTPAQAKAREALRKKMAELDAPGAAAETPAQQLPEAKKKTAPAPAPQPAAQPPPAVITPAPSTPPAAVAAAPAPSPTPQMRSSSEETARQREAVRRKIAELNTQETSAQSSPAPPATKTAAKQPKQKSAEVIQAEEKAAAAEEERLAAEAKARKAKAGKKQFTAMAGVPSTAFAPLPAPPPAVPASKEARLADLLRKYKADAVSPGEYHTQRASILAEP